MGKKNLFLVSYILDNQPASCEIESDAQTLTPEQALTMIKEQHSGTGKITDVQVQQMIEPKDGGTTPEHHTPS
ncbi:hypothetical protein [Pseudomonas saliphila]|uniref:hypothetical protein n=1 Tax=Pseudomonas saliphila TaxID=2586906 RepID=UPI00123AD790|nr:hypothetical protein [Pseudomonas saliphila]